MHQVHGEGGGRPFAPRAGTGEGCHSPYADAAYGIFGGGLDGSNKAPIGLRAAGRAVWRGILDDLGADWELDRRELFVLEAAARQADLNRSLEVALEEDGVRVAGVKGSRA